MASSSLTFVHFGRSALNLALASRATHAAESEGQAGASRFRAAPLRPAVIPDFLILCHPGPREPSDRLLTYISDAHTSHISRPNRECAMRSNPAIDCASRDFANAITDIRRQPVPRGPWRFRPVAPSISLIFVRYRHASQTSTSHYECAMRPNLAAGGVARDSARALACRSPIRFA